MIGEESELLPVRSPGSTTHEERGSPTAQSRWAAHISEYMRRNNWSLELQVRWFVITAMAIAVGACTKSGLSTTQVVWPSVPPTIPASPDKTLIPKETSTVQAEDYPWHIFEVSKSHDRLWTARTMYQLEHPEGHQKTCIEVTSSDSEHTWSLTYDWDIKPGLTATTRIVDWSDDGAFLFYSNAFLVGGCQTFSYGGDLSVLDLDTGIFRELLPIQNYGVGTWFSVSPEATMVAFPPDVEGSSITIVNFDDGDEEIIQLDLDMAQPGYRIGNIVWSPDSEKIAFAINLNPCDPTDKGPFGSALGIADTKTLVSTILFFDENRHLQIESWRDTSTLFIDEIQGQILMLDTETGNLTDW